MWEGMKGEQQASGMNGLYLRQNPDKKEKSYWWTENYSNCIVDLFTFSNNTEVCADWVITKITLLLESTMVISNKFHTFLKLNPQYSCICMS